MILLPETSELACPNEVLLIGGTHDGKRLRLDTPEDVGEVRLPLFTGRTGEFLYESYRRVYTNIFAIEGMDDEAALQRLVQGYRSKGAVEFGVVEVGATTEAVPSPVPRQLFQSATPQSSA